jgi:hypothetical protein
MKTITEFSPTPLKEASRIRAELAAVGKTPEEIPAGLGEALKLEGDKLTHLMSAIEVVADKTADLKRVLVFSLGEGEKAPSGAKELNGAYFLVEYYPPIAGQGGQRKFQDKRPGKDHSGKRKGKRGAGERGAGGRSAGERRGPRPQTGEAGAAGPSAAAESGGERRPRADRGERAGRGKPRGERPARPAVEAQPSKPLTIPKPKEGFVKKPTPPEALEEIAKRRAAEAAAAAAPAAGAAPQVSENKEAPTTDAPSSAAEASQA